MDFTVILNQIIILFIVLFIGLIIRKRDIIDDHATKKISSLVVNVAAPALIINGMVQQGALDTAVFLEMLILALVLYGVLVALTFLVPKIFNIEKADVGIYMFMMLFSNVGFMGFPIIASIFGEEAIFYAAIFNLPFNLLLYTLGIYFVSMHKETQVKFKWKKMMNPGVVAVAIGLILLVTGLKLPVVAAESIDLVGSLTTPLSMLVIGASLSNVKIKSLFTNPMLYLYSFIKLLALPLATLFILRAFHVEGVVLGVCVILMGMPVAANAVMLSKEFGGNDVLASEGIFISTMLSILTIPVVMLLLAM